MRDYDDLIKNLREYAELVDHDMWDCPYMIADSMKQAADAVEELSKPKWISVEDELPKKGTVVLAFGTRSATTGMFQGVGTAPWFWWWKGHTIKRVTHWMPLPSMEGLNET